MDPTRLRDTLLETAASGDHNRLAQFCTAHAEAIVKHVGEWSQPASVDAADSEAWETRIGGL